jgi:Flp pilus assembly protein TadD
VLAKDPEFTEAYLWRGRALLQAGRHKEAVADLETAYHLNPTSQTIPATLAYTYGLTGNRAKANSLLRRLFAESRERYVSPWAIGMIYLGLGDRPHAFDWFEKAVRERSPHMVAAFAPAPECDPLQTEPRFKKLLEAMKRPN